MTVTNLQPKMAANARSAVASSSQPMTAIDTFRQDAWTKQDPRLPSDWADLTPDWYCDPALVEIDILAAKALGLNLDELQTIYRIQFPAMRQKEAETYYGPNGRIVFTPSKGLPGVGLPRKAIKGDTSYTLTTPEGTKKGIALGWECIHQLQEGNITRQVKEDMHPSGLIERQIVYLAPLNDPQHEQAYDVWTRHLR